MPGIGSGAECRLNGSCRGGRHRHSQASSADLAAADRHAQASTADPAAADGYAISPDCNITSTNRHLGPGGPADCNFTTCPNRHDRTPDGDDRATGPSLGHSNHGGIADDATYGDDSGDCIADRQRALDSGGD